MTELAKEATTVRRVLEPLFHNFDTGNHWSSDGGIACAVLCDMEVFMESGNLWRRNFTLCVIYAGL